MASTDARPVAQKNVAYRVYFPILDADGDPVAGATGLDSEISKDAGTFADCTNEATEIATSSGMYYLDLTSTEMNADAVCIQIKTSSSGAKTTNIVLYPEEAGDIRVNATQLNGTGLTGRDIGASVLVSSGTGTGQLDVASGVVKADLRLWIGTAPLALVNQRVNADAQAIRGSTSAGDNVVVVFATDFATNYNTTNDQWVVDANRISGDATAADNAESFFDGTGYAGTNNVIPLVTAVTTVNGLAANSVNASALATDAVTEIQSGLATATAVDDLPTNAELATALASADDAVLAQVALVKAKTDNLPSDPADQSLVIAATDALATLIGDVPTNSELATALAGADDATLAAITALPTAVQNADALLNRDLATGTDSGSTTVRTVRQALRFLRNRWGISGGTLTVYKEDDTTESWSGAVTQTAGDPVSQVDPGGP